MNNIIFKKLIENFRMQDMTSFAIIYDEFKGLIYHYSGKLCDDDAVSELTLFLLELLYEIDIKKFSNDGSDGIQKYIAVALRNKYISLSKNKQRDIQIYRDLCLNEEIFDDSPLAKINICEALSKLTDRQRSIIIYKYIYGFPDSDISRMLNISRQAVNRLKNRGLEELKDYYAV